MSDPNPTPDGPPDVKTDVSKLSENAKEHRLNMYLKWYKRGGRLTTAAGITLQFDLETEGQGQKASRIKWKENGEVSIATTSCKMCMEINTLRPKNTPPFVCLVKSNDAYTRRDGTTLCLFCTCSGGNSIECQARSGSTPVKSTTVKSAPVKSSPSSSSKREYRLSLNRTTPSSLIQDEQRVEKDLVMIDDTRKKVSPVKERKALDIELPIAPATVPARVSNIEVVQTQSLLDLIKSIEIPKEVSISKTETAPLTIARGPTATVAPPMITKTPAAASLLIAKAQAGSLNRRAQELEAGSSSKASQPRALINGTSLNETSAPSTCQTQTAAESSEVQIATPFQNGSGPKVSKARATSSLQKTTSNVNKRNRSTSAKQAANILPKESSIIVMDRGQWEAVEKSIAELRKKYEEIEKKLDRVMAERDSSTATSAQSVSQPSINGSPGKEAMDRLERHRQECIQAAEDVLAVKEDIRSLKRQRYESALQQNSS